MISCSPRCDMRQYRRDAPRPRRSGMDGRRALSVLRRRRRATGMPTRTPPMRSNGSRRLPSASSTRSGMPSARPQDCHSETMSRPRSRDKASSRTQDPNAPGRRQLRPASSVSSSPSGSHAKIGGDRQVDRHLYPAQRSTQTRRARGGARPCARAHRRHGLHSRSAGEGRRGRAALRDSTPPAWPCWLLLDASTPISPPGMSRLVSPRRGFPRSICEGCLSQVGKA